MAVLIDTSILARLANSTDTHYHVADRAVTTLHQRGEVLHIAPQNLIEFRAVATRPIKVNGLGLNIEATERKAAIFETAFSLQSETPDIFLAWKSLISELSVIGKRVHDARLVAICHVHQVTSLMTFNISHFTGLSTFGSGIQIVDPATV